MAAAPFCDLTVPIPPGNPTKPKGFQTIPPGATPAQMIRIINYNFNLLAPGGGSTINVTNTRNTPNTTNSSPGPTKLDNWTEVPGSRVTQKVRVYHQAADGSIDKTQFIDFIRIQRITLEDNGTKASWVWSRGNTGDGPNVQILPS